MKSRLEALVTEMVERGILFEDAVEEFEKHFILGVLKRTNGNLSKAAEESAHTPQHSLKARGEVFSERPHDGRASAPRPQERGASYAPREK